MALRAVADLKSELQSRGVRLSLGPCGVETASGRKGGAGPAEGVTLLLEGSPASVPAAAPYVAASPFELRREESPDGCVLYRDGERVGVSVSLVPEPGFYRGRTAAGISYRKIALLHGADCLASTVLQSCMFWAKKSACRFCGIGLSLRDGCTVAVKRPSDLAEVARAAAREGVRHVTLTAGTTRDRLEEWRLFLETARVLRREAGLPVHVQMMPPLGRSMMAALRDAGVSTIGIHVESLDPAALRAASPCKAALPLSVYRRAWADALAVFGPNQVTSFVLLGLGEDAAKTLEGCRRLAEWGVYPYLVPLRPIPGTALGNRNPPSVALVRDLYEEVASLLRACGLGWRKVRAGCVRCRGCSALPDYEDALAGEGRANRRGGVVASEVVKSGPLLDLCLAVRHEVFVREQRMFRETDRDSLDGISLHVALRRGREVVGTVRLTPIGGDTWLGSRLAILPAWRGALGPLLVRRAVEEVERRGARRFFAYIQLSRVRFFQRLGWRSIEVVPDYCGRPHVLMEAPLRAGCPGGRHDSLSEEESLPRTSAERGAGSPSF